MKSTLPIQIHTITAAETIDLRHRVMWPDHPKENVIIDDDATATHFGAILQGKIIGVASFFPDGTSYRLRKLAVDQEFQRMGVASAILTTATAELRKLGCTQIWCDARKYASAFYQRNGFELGAQTFQKNGMDYVKAYRAV
jgi:ribosomal protein S18 acetylase RimI-like enzyme